MLIGLFPDGQMLSGSLNGSIRLVSLKMVVGLVKSAHKENTALQ